MSSVNKILETHSRVPQDPKETKQIADQMLSDLSHEGMVPPAPAKTPPPSKRGPGRPRGSTSKSPGPGPRPKAKEIEALSSQMPTMAQSASSPEAIAEKMKSKRLIRKLRAYKRHFPELLGEDLSSVNPHACTYDQLVQLIDSCKEVIGDEIENQTMPDVMGSLLDNLELAAVRIATEADPDSAAKHLIHLRNFSRAAKADPCIAMDLKLIACEWTGIMPQSPYLRLAINLFKCASGLVQQNMTQVASLSTARVDEEKYAEF